MVELKNINNKNSICTCSDFNKNIFDEIINKKTSLVLLGFDSSDHKLFDDLSTSTLIDNLFIISNFKKIHNKYNISNKIQKNMLKNVNRNLVVAIKLNNNYIDTKKTIKNLILLKKLCDDFNINTFSQSENTTFFGFVNSKNSIYLDDVIAAISSLFITNRKKSIEYIYDYVCDSLDKKFKVENYCKFESDNTCIANRNHTAFHPTMGCCYSFEYTGLFSTKFIKNISLCKYLDCKTCSTKCITCKMFTCKYLKSQNVVFNCSNILLLDCFFTKKQHLILESNFFRTKEEIIKKLLIPSRLPLSIYYVLKKYYIN